MGDVGLIIGLGLDASGARAGMQDAEADLAGFGKTATSVAENDLAGLGRGAEEAAEKTDRGILSNRESARLLSEELGIHLPRAVASGIAEMLPAIGSLGGALLAAFAVKATVEFGEELKKVAEAANDVAESEKRMKRYGDENIELVKELAKENKNLARQEATRLLVEAAAAESGMEHLRAEMDFRERWGTGLGIIVNYMLGKYSDLDKAQEKHDGIVGLAAQFNKIFADDVVADNKRVTKSTEERYKTEEAAERRAFEETKRSVDLAASLYEKLYFSLNDVDPAYQKLIHDEQEIQTVTDAATRSMLDQMAQMAYYKEQAEELAKILENPPKLKMPGVPADMFQPLVDGYHQLTEAQRAALPLSDAIDDSLLRQAREIHELREEMDSQELPAMRRITLEYQRRRDDLDREMEKERQLGLVHKITLAQMEADEAAYARAKIDIEKAEAEAKREAAEAEARGAASEIATFVGAIAGRKAQAEVEGVFYLAEGAFDVARGIYPPNPGLITRGLGEIGAGINMLKVAGRSGRAPNISGGGGGAGVGLDDHGGRYGSGSDREQYPPQTVAPGAAGGAGGRFGTPALLVVHGSSDAFAALASAVTGAANAGHTVISTSSQRGAPVGH